MYVVLLGALLELVGIVYLVVRVIMHEPLASPASSTARDTLEPPAGGGVLSLKGSWPGYAMIALGALLLLIGGHV
jgi:hypothetical protein